MHAQALAKELICDGCGMGATPEHIANRLRRLELTTRYRPIHIQTVFLGAQSPADERDFLYAAELGFRGEGAALLLALGISSDGRTADAVLAEFQKRGVLLTHILECAADVERGNADLAEALRRRLPSVARRLRGSLRPKRVILISKDLTPIVGDLKSGQLGCDLVLNDGVPFDLESSAGVSTLTSAMRSL